MTERPEKPEPGQVWGNIDKPNEQRRVMSVSEHRIYWMHHVGSGGHSGLVAWQSWSRDKQIISKGEA